MKVLKHSIIYLTGEILSKALSFSTIPLITKFLVPAEYGLYGIYQAIIALITPFQRMALELEITKNFYKNNVNLTKIINIIFQLLTLNTFVIIIIFILISLFTKDPFSLPFSIWLSIPVLIFLQSINTFLLTILRNQEKPINYITLQLLSTAIFFILIIVIMFLKYKKWTFLVIALLLSQLTTAVYSLVNLKKIIKRTMTFPSLEYFKVYKATFPLIFHLLGGSIIFFSDKLLIQHLTGNEKVGLYTLATQLGGVTTIVISALLLAINPWIYKSLSKRTEISNKLIYIKFLFIIVGVICWFIIKLIYVFFIENSYFESFDVINWLIIAFVFRGWYQLYYNYLVHYNYTSVLMWITISIAIINIVLNYIFINILGYKGASISTTISFLALYLIVYFIAIKLHKGAINK